MYHEPADVDADPFAAIERERRRRAQYPYHRIAFVNGAFDLLHVGHVRLLRYAASVADHVVVAINADAVVARKGPGRPWTPALERAEIVGNVYGVNHVFIFDDDEPTRVVEAIRPHVLVKGADYRDLPVPEARVLPQWGGRLLLAPWDKAHDSRAIAARIKSPESG